MFFLKFLCYLSIYLDPVYFKISLIFFKTKIKIYDCDYTIYIGTIIIIYSDYKLTCLPVKPGSLVAVSSNRLLF